MSLRLLAIDDQPSVCLLLASVAGQDPRFAPVATANNGTTALRLATEQPPDVITLDAALGSDDGLALIPDLKRAAPNAAVAVFSSAPYADARSAAKAGADLFVEKGSDLDVLLDQLVELAAQPT